MRPRVRKTSRVVFSPRDTSSDLFEVARSATKSVRYAASKDRFLQSRGLRVKRSEGHADAVERIPEGLSAWEQMRCKHQTRWPGTASGDRRAERPDLARPPQLQGSPHCLPRRRDATVRTVTTVRSVEPADHAGAGSRGRVAAAQGCSPTPISIASFNDSRARLTRPLTLNRARPGTAGHACGRRRCPPYVAPSGSD